mmetsp:Transcript_6643/g.19647  ORF Transcript_6643/g.19647 Transcript_6643/m.19647 type:complete len:264 (+) Transcript_6643:1124-1915(+)
MWSWPLHQPRRRRSSGRPCLDPDLERSVRRTSRGPSRRSRRRPKRGRRRRHSTRILCRRGRRRRRRSARLAPHDVGAPNLAFAKSRPVVIEPLPEAAAQVGVTRVVAFVVLFLEPTPVIGGLVGGGGETAPEHAQPPRRSVRKGEYFPRNCLEAESPSARPQEDGGNPRRPNFDTVDGAVVGATSAITFSSSIFAISSSPRSSVAIAIIAPSISAADSSSSSSSPPFLNHPAPPRNAEGGGGGGRWRWRWRRRGPIGPPRRRA